MHGDSVEKAQSRRECGKGRPASAATLSNVNHARAASPCSSEGRSRTCWTDPGSSSSGRRQTRCKANRLDALEKPYKTFSNRPAPFGWRARECFERPVAVEKATEC